MRGHDNSERTARLTDRWLASVLVIPAKAGIRTRPTCRLDARVRGHDNLDHTPAQSAALSVSRGISDDSRALRGRAPGPGWRSSGRGRAGQAGSFPRAPELVAF